MQNVHNQARRKPQRFLEVVFLLLQEKLSMFV